MTHQNTVNSFGSISDKKLIQELELAIANLLWTSEAEYPFEIVYWQEGDRLNEEILLQHYDYAPQTKIRTQNIETFFAAATTECEWHNEAEQAKVKRYRKLASLLLGYLANVRVYLIGEVEIDVYILGETEQAIAGLTTKTIAT